MTGELIFYILNIYRLEKTLCLKEKYTERRTCSNVYSAKGVITHEENKIHNGLYGNAKIF